MSCIAAKNVSECCLPCLAQSSYMFTNMWEYELAQGGPHSAMELISLSLHTNPAVLSMQMREEKREGGLSWVCSVSASLLLHFKWINDKSPLFSLLVTVLSHSLSLSIYWAPSLSPPVSPAFIWFWVYCDFPLTVCFFFSLLCIWSCFCIISKAHIKRLIWPVVGIVILAINCIYLSALEVYN